MTKNQNDDLLKILDGADFSGMLATNELAHQDELRRILLSFLEVLDSVDRAASKQEGGATLRVIQKQLLDTCEKAGIIFFNSKGKPFDPLRHQAVESYAGELAAEMVLEEITRGCEWNGKLLRPAGVVVVMRS